METKQNKKKKERNEEVTTDLVCGRKNGIEGQKRKKLLTPEGSWWCMLIPQDCTAHDQTIEKYFIMLTMQTMLNVPKIILARHAENTVSTDQ